MLAPMKPRVLPPIPQRTQLSATLAKGLHDIGQRLTKMQDRQGDRPMGSLEPETSGNGVETVVPKQ